MTLNERNPHFKVTGHTIFSYWISQKWLHIQP